MDWKVCEYCGESYDQSEFGVDQYGEIQHGQYATVYCSMKCYNAACNVSGTAAYRYIKKQEAIEAENEAYLKAQEIKCKKCGKSFPVNEWLKEGTPEGICYTCWEIKDRAEKAEAERKARAQKEEQEAQERKEKEEHDALIARCVQIDGAYYSPDKTTLIEVDKIVRRLVVPEGVIEIGTHACKECTQLKSITLPEGLEEIESAAFIDCSSLTSISFPSTLKKIGDLAFQRTGLLSVELLDGMEIGDAAFAYNDSLESVSIPANLKKLVKHTFAENKSLKTIHFAEGASLLCNGMFQNCTSLKEVTLPEGITEIPDWMFVGCTALTSVHIPESLEKIGEKAFKNCTSLKDISHILNQVKELNGGSFQNTGVTEVTISENIKKLHSYDEKINGNDYTKGAFADCEKLKSVTIAEGKGVLGSALFVGCTSLETVSLPTTLKNIGWGTFKKCTSLQNIKIPENVSDIKDSAFSKCSMLSEITIPASVTTLGTYAFNECSSLKTLTIPSSITTLEKGIVEDCTSLETLIIPSTITQLTDNPFKGCKSLKVIAVEGDTVISSDVLNKLNEYAEKNFGKGTVKIKSGAAATIAKNIGSGLGSMLGTAATKIKENEDLKNAGKQIKDDFKKAFGGLFGKK